MKRKVTPDVRSQLIDLLSVKTELPGPQAHLSLEPAAIEEDQDLQGSTAAPDCDSQTDSPMAVIDPSRQPPELVAEENVAAGLKEEHVPCSRPVVP